MVARGLLDTLRAVGDSDEQTTAVLTNMVKLSEDSGNSCDNMWAFHIA